MLDLILRHDKEGSVGGREERQVARMLLYKLFYDQTDHGVLTLLQKLIKEFDFERQPRRWGGGTQSLVFLKKNVTV